MENLDVEIWKDVPGYEGVLQVSNLGRVLRLSRKVTRRTKWGGIMEFMSKPHFVKVSNIGKGYYNISIQYDNKKQENLLLHRAVASAFIENPQNKPCINHIDGDKSNNALVNLEWVTHKENTTHRFNVLNQKGSRYLKLNSGYVRKINQYSMDGEYIKTYPSLSEACFVMSGKRNNGNIKAVLSGRCHHAYGYIWKYAD